MTLWLISDTHFSHANIITYCGRPFANADEMDEGIVENWNAVVRDCDHVYHLGDVALRRQHLGIVKRLNGKKRLVLGNHDIFEVKDYLAAGFQKVMAYRVLDGCLLSHIPVHQASMGRFRANIHGHIHQHEGYGAPYINVSIERTAYAPIALEAVTRGLPPQQSREESFGEGMSSHAEILSIGMGKAHAGAHSLSSSALPLPPTGRQMKSLRASAHLTHRDGQDLRVSGEKGSER